MKEEEEEEGGEGEAVAPGSQMQIALKQPETRPGSG